MTWWLLDGVTSLSPIISFKLITNYFSYYCTTIWSPWLYSVHELGTVQCTAILLFLNIVPIVNMSHFNDTCANINYTLIKNSILDTRWNILEWLHCGMSNIITTMCSWYISGYINQVLLQIFQIPTMKWMKVKVERKLYFISCWIHIKLPQRLKMVNYSTRLTIYSITVIKRRRNVQAYKIMKS